MTHVASLSESRFCNFTLYSELSVWMAVVLKSCSSLGWNAVSSWHHQVSLSPSSQGGWLVNLQEASERMSVSCDSKVCEGMTVNQRSKNEAPCCMFISLFPAYVWRSKSHKKAEQPHRGGHGCQKKTPMILLWFYYLSGALNKLLWTGLGEAGLD